MIQHSPITYLSGFVLSLMVCVVSFADAQTSRQNTKRIVAYRSNYDRMACGNNGSHTLEIRNGTLWAWGSNATGELGDSSTTDRKFPVRIDKGTNWVSISAGGGHSLGIKADGTLWAWGYNLYGQIGDGSTTNRLKPVQIGTATNWVSVKAGRYFTLAIKADGTLWAWGRNDYGQFGDGTNTNSKIPLQIGSGSTWISIAAGTVHSLGIKANGTLWAWGSNANGQVGDSTYSHRSSPVQLGRDKNWTTIAAGTAYSFAIKANGTLWSWGWNFYGQLGDGTTDERNYPLRVGNDTSWVSVTAGFAHVSGMQADGTLWGWGWNAYGQVGDGSTTNRTTPVQIGSDRYWISVVAGHNYLTGLKADGTLWAWGYNNNGQLGDSSTTSRYNPKKVRNAPAEWISIDACGGHTLAVKSNGSIWAWGRNDDYQLGDGSTNNSSTPVRVRNDSSWVAVSAGIDFSLGLKADGTLWSWGDNDFGQCGDSTTTLARSSPVRVAGSANWITFAAGYEYGLGIKADGTLWGWGYNDLGQVGDSTNAERIYPVKISADNNWVSVSAGKYHSLGIKADGTLWAWGYNGSGRFGNGTTTDKWYPIQIGSVDNWITVSAGTSHSLAIRSDGSLWAWGYNGTGQLGDSTAATNRTAPVKIGFDRTWLSVSGKHNHSMGIKSNGTLWGWGDNAYSQVGDSFASLQKYPAKRTGSDWVKVTAGGLVTIGLKADRIKYCGNGTNTDGQLGDGTTTNRSSIACIGAFPEINVKGNSKTIVDGDYSPSFTDSTDFGIISSASVRHTYTIENTGPGTLKISSIVSSGSSASEYKVTGAPDTVAIGSSAKFYVTFTPAGKGVRYATIGIYNNDPDELLYDFSVSGSRQLPDINVRGNSVSIVDGDTTPSLSDSTDFGSISTVSIKRSFTIENLGSAALNIQSIIASGVNASDFIISGVPSTIASGKSAKFYVTFLPASNGIKTATLTINNNDMVEGVYTFAITGAKLTPEINVKGNSVSIMDGDITPSLSDSTDFGVISSTFIRRMFTIENTGTSPLTISSIVSGGANASEFKVSGIPGVISAGNSARFTVTFIPVATGLRKTTVTINNNDADEAAYEFDIQGEKLAPEIQVKGNSVVIANGDIVPSLTDSTDFGMIKATSVTRSFLIENIGTYPLQISLVSVSGINATEFTLSGVPNTIAAGNSARFYVTFKPTGNGTRSATLTIYNDDDDEPAYGFSIEGSRAVPEINVKGNSVEIADGDASPSSVDSTDFGVVFNNNILTRSFTIENTGTDVLLVSNIKLSGANAADFSLTGIPSAINDGSSATFYVAYAPAAKRISKATITINNNDADEAVYNFDITATRKDTSSNFIETLNYTDVVRIFPNPANLELSIFIQNDFENAELSIYSADGKLVLHQQLTDAGQSSVDLSQIASGVYTVAIKIDGQSQVHKLIIQK